MEKTGVTVKAPPRVLSPEAVADLLDVSLRTVYRLLQDGKLPGVRIGRLWRVPAEDLAAVLKATG